MNEACFSESASLNITDIDFFPLTGLLIITLGLIANFFVFSPHIGQFDYIIFMCGYP